MSSHNSASSPGQPIGTSGGGYDFLYSPRPPRQHRGTGGSMGASYESNGGGGGSYSHNDNGTHGANGGGSLAQENLQQGSMGATGGSMRSVGSRSGAGTPGSPHSEHGRVLEGHAELLVPPTLTAVDRETPGNCRALFLGHMRFETTVAEVRWLLYTTANVIAAKAEPRGNGCFVVYLATDTEVDAVRLLHKRLLFDHHGVWFARDADEAAYMNEYVDNTLANTRRRRLRLPKDCMVVEEPRSTPHAVNRQSPSPVVGVKHQQQPPPAPAGGAYPSAAVMAYGMDDGSSGTDMYAAGGASSGYGAPSGYAGPPLPGGYGGPAPTGYGGPAPGGYGGGDGYGQDSLYEIPDASAMAPPHLAGGVSMPPPPMPTYQKNRD